MRCSYCSDPGKRTKNAGPKKQAPAYSGTGQHIRAEEEGIPTWDGLSEKLDAVMGTMVDLFQPR